MKLFELIRIFHSTGCKDKPVITDEQLKELIVEARKTADVLRSVSDTFMVDYIIIGLRVDAEAAQNMLDARDRDTYKD